MLQDLETDTKLMHVIDVSVRYKGIKTSLTQKKKATVH